MHHRLQSTLLIFLFLGSSIAIGVLLQGGFPSSAKGSFLTGAVVAEGAPDPACKGRACTIACRENEDCDDKVTETADICRNPGTLNSLCVYLPRQ